MEINMFVKRSMLFVVALLFVISHSLALGVTPAKNLFELGEDNTISGSFKIINNDQLARELVISTRGDLGRNIELETRRVSVSASDSDVVVSYTVRVPEGLSPGRHNGEIIISEEVKATASDDDIVGAVLSVVTNIEIFNPYPGKYAEAKMIANNAAPGKGSLIVIPVINLGEFNLASVYANIDIYSSAGEKIDSFNTKKISILADKKAELSAVWGENAPVGKYKAIATVIYDGESATVEDTFQLGVASLTLHEVTVNNFRLGQIAKMDLLVENTWSEAFTDVYTQVKIYGSNGQVLADFNSPTGSVSALEKSVLSSYWDTAGVQEGIYDATVIIHYEGDKSVETDIQFDVGQNSINVIGVGFALSDAGEDGFSVSDNLVLILVIVIGILVLLNLLWFFILRKMMNRSKK